MSKATQIHFCTWPDGKVLEGSQTSVSQDMAIGAALRTFLPEQWFPGLPINSRYLYGHVSELWKAMSRAGFKVHSLDLPQEVADGVSY